MQLAQDLLVWRVEQPAQTWMKMRSMLIGEMFGHDARGCIVSKLT